MTFGCVKCLARGVGINGEVEPTSAGNDRKLPVGIAASGTIRKMRAVMSDVRSFSTTWPLPSAIQGIYRRTLTILKADFQHLFFP